MRRPKGNAQPGGVGREEEAAEAENLAEKSATLATKAHQVAAKIPYLLTREARRDAVRELLSMWLQVLRGEVA